MKNFRETCWLFVISFVFANTIIGADQVTLFKGFAQSSWKLKKIESFDEKTLEQHIVNTFNFGTWGSSQDANKILWTPADMTAIKNYCNTCFIGTGVKQWDFWLIAEGAIEFYANDSPRRWATKLDIYEIFRFQKFLNDNRGMIAEENNANDGLVRAKFLCGVFWEVETKRNREITAVRCFGGMLRPAQEFNDAPEHEYDVYTCVHGFKPISISEGATIDYYFVPYGIPVSSDVSRDDFVVNKGFKVTKIWKHAISLGGENFSDMDINQINLIKDENSCDQDDFAVVKIASKNTNNQHLKNVLISSKKNMDLGENAVFKDEHFSLQNIVCQQLDREHYPERLFVIGLSNLHGMADGYGLVISTSTRDTDDIVLEDGDNALRSLSDDGGIKQPNTIGCKNEYVSSLATCFGMSGGPVFKCKLIGDGSVKSCEFIGTVWGAERVFASQENIIKKFGCFINKAPQ
ncbi:MAG: hypothetical protein LBJ89_00925 [Holosporales bacterium]|jgi:hypothetical protein|nr:hypothetical protein [Holosporales bacterium]